MSTNTDPTIVLDTGRSGGACAVAFYHDGIHVLAGGEGAVQRWRLADGQEVGKQTGLDFRAISVSRDHKWVVCGIYASGAGVWDTELRQKVIHVEGKTTVRAVDVSSDSTRFATGSEGREASVWSISSGERLVGPLDHDGEVTGVKFSPNGEHIATACKGKSVRVFNTHNGDEVINIKTTTPSTHIITPLAWSNDGQQIFAASEDNKVRSFEVSTGSQLAETQISEDGMLESIVLATNNKFLATNAGRTISFLDTSTLTQIGPVITDSTTIYSIALSPDCNYLATGQTDGKISVRTLGRILPDFYGPFSISTPKESQQGEQPKPLTLGNHSNERPDSTKEQPGDPKPVESVVHDEGGGGGLLEVEEPSSSPAPEFNYNESLSLASSVHPHEEEVPSPGTSNAVPQSLDALPTASPPDPPLEEDIDMAKSSQGISKLKRLLPTRIRRSNKDSTLHEPDRLPRNSHQAIDDQSRSHSPSRVEDSNVGPSTMAAARPKRRVVATSFRVPEPKRKSRAKPAQSNKGASRSGQGAAGAAGAGQAQQANDTSHPPDGRVRLTDQRETGDVIFAIRLPAWMCCRGSATEDGTHG